MTAIRATDIQNFSGWGEQPCPICRKPLALHLLLRQDVSAEYATRQLTISADVVCGKA